MNVTRAKNQCTDAVDGNTVTEEEQGMKCTGKKNTTSKCDLSSTGNGNDSIDGNLGRTENLNDRGEWDIVGPDIRMGGTDADNDQTLDNRIHENKLKRPPAVDASMTSSGGGRIREEWRLAAEEARHTMQEILLAEHSMRWNARVVHVERVKSYGPRIDHLVVDIDCRPTE